MLTFLDNPIPAPATGAGDSFETVVKPFDLPSSSDLAVAAAPAAGCTPCVALAAAETVEAAAAGRWPVQRYIKKSTPQTRMAPPADPTAMPTMLPVDKDEPEELVPEFDEPDEPESDDDEPPDRPLPPAGLVTPVGLPNEVLKAAAVPSPGTVVETSAPAADDTDTVAGLTPASSQIKSRVTRTSATKSS